MATLEDERGGNHLIILRRECPGEIFLRGSFSGLFLPVLGRVGDVRRGERSLKSRCALEERG